MLRGADELLFGTTAGGPSVQVKVYSAYVEVWYQAKCVARHERCYERHQKVLELEHYLDALTKKPGALAGSTALEQCRAQGRWPASYDRFWEMLKEREGKQAGTRAMIDVLLLGREYGTHRKASDGKGAGTGLFDWGDPLPLECARPGKREAKPVDIGALRRYDRPQPTPGDYERLLPNCPATEVIQ